MIIFGVCSLHDHIILSHSTHLPGGCKGSSHCGEGYPWNEGAQGAFELLARGLMGCMGEDTRSLAYG